MRFTIDGRCATLLITATGKLLALVQASLSHWGKEKWNCPEKDGATVNTIRGNGSRNVLTVLGTPGSGLTLKFLPPGHICRMPRSQPELPRLSGNNLGLLAHGR
ncbi:hypothetical protein BBP40_007832 [Aspergillus hancockii]|nr:hypothetical protein BBP40_007832 [Aspergillus hancockii]